MSVEAFGNQLRRLRMATGMTQESLAEAAGLSVRGISDLERGVKLRPHPETVRMLAAALNLVAGRARRVSGSCHPPHRVGPWQVPRATQPADRARA